MTALDFHNFSDDFSLLYDDGLWCWSWSGLDFLRLFRSLGQSGNPTVNVSIDFIEIGNHFFGFVIAFRIKDMSLETIAESFNLQNIVSTIPVVLFVSEKQQSPCDENHAATVKKKERATLSFFLFKFPVVHGRRSFHYDMFIIA